MLVTDVKGTRSMSPTSPADRPMLRLAEDLLAAKKTEERLLQLTRAVIETVDGVDYASISFADHEGIRTLAATDDLVNKLDATQYELREGPCYEAATQTGVVMTTDVGRDDRWPRFGPRAASLGIAAHVAHRILNTGDERAALNMYSTELGAIVADSEVVDMVLSEAALVLGLTRERDQVEEVMQSRTAIAQAIGLVMGHCRVDSDAAFRYLVRRSQSENRKLRLIAQELIAEADRSPQECQVAETGITGAGSRRTRVPQGAESPEVQDASLRARPSFSA